MAPEVRGRRVAQALLAFVAGLVALHLAWSASGHLGGVLPFDLVNDWVYLTAVGGSALACVLRARTGGNRVAWGWIAAGLAAWTAAETAWVVQPEFRAPTPADLVFLVSYGCFYVGLVRLMRGRVRRLSASLWLDGLIAGLASAAFAAALFFGPVLTELGGDAGTLAMDLAYLIADLVLLGLVAGVAVARGERHDRTWVLVAAGLAINAVADSLYLRGASAGTYVEGGLLDSAWPASTFLLALAAWQRTGARVARDTPRSPSTAVPVIGGLAMVALLALSPLTSGRVAASVLASLALVCVVVRLGLSLRENGRLLVATHDEARLDALTGLRNRRALLADLDAAVASGAEHALVLFDLDGFKRYNDSFGHPAGDALLSRLGDRLAAAVARYGDAYRLGGDEFCVLAPVCAGRGAEALAGLAAHALTQSGEGFEVSSSSGTVTLPREANDSAGAIGLADRRMYSSKRARPGDDVGTRSALLRALREGDPDLGLHMDRVALLAGVTARALGLASDDLDAVVRAAELHDVGKMAIPDAILCRSGPLSAEEWGFIRRHTVIGERILAAAPALAPVGTIVRSSHERWDGGGYPDALGGDAIPLGARIVFVCDAYDVMTTRRAYREPLSHEVALAELLRGSGTQFDPAVVEAFRAARAADALRPGRPSESAERPRHGEAARARPVA